jgi:cytochrome b pre-mRNA-processing protein 3
MAFSLSLPGRKAAARKAARQAYEGLLKAALQPVHYLEHGVPDTFEGRAQMVTLLTAAACARLAEIGGPDAARLAEALNTRVLDGFDAAFREKGVGDASIARKVRKLAETHSGLGRAVMEALGEGEEAAQAQLPAILARNGVASGEPATRLAAALTSLRRRFQAQPESEILAGALDWPLEAPPG